MDDKLAEAIQEMSRLYEFHIVLLKLPSLEMIKRIQERDPEFITELDDDGRARAGTIIFWADYCNWSVYKLRNKYRDLWEQLRNAYLSPASKDILPGTGELSELVRQQILDILKKSSF